MTGTGMTLGAALLTPAFAPAPAPKIRSDEYWVKKGNVSLYLFRKRVAAAPNAGRPVLFLVHGSSMSSRPTFDLSVTRPRRVTR